MFSSSMFFSSSSSFLPLFAFVPKQLIQNSSHIQFGIQGALEHHGFARNRHWVVDLDPPPFPTSSPNKAFVDLILKPSEEDAKIWPHRCMTQFW